MLTLGGVFHAMLVVTTLISGLREVFAAHPGSGLISRYLQRSLPKWGKATSSTYSTGAIFTC